MDIQLPKFHAPHKLLTPWWDVVIDYLTVAMVSISVTAFGLQTSKDQLICIAAVNCSPPARNESVLGAPNPTDHKINVCGKPSRQALNEGIRPTTVLTTLADRRRYDYVESECYSELPFFPKYFSLILFAEALLLLAITHLWYSKIRSYERLLVEFLNNEELLRYAFSNKTTKEEEEEMKPEVANFCQKLLLLVQQNGKRPTFFHRKFARLSSQYKFRVGIELLTSLCFVISNLSLFAISSNYSQCHLQKAFFLTEYINEYFECSRSIDTYYNIVVYIFSIVLILNGIALVNAYVWAKMFPNLTTDQDFVIYLLQAAGQTSSLSSMCYDGLSQWQLKSLSTAEDKTNTTTEEDTRLDPENQLNIRRMTYV